MRQPNFDEEEDGMRVVDSDSDEVFDDEVDEYEWEDDDDFVVDDDDDEDDDEEVFDDDDDLVL